MEHVNPLRIGLVGLGRHGARYARHLARGDVPGATLGPVWRRDEAAGRSAAAELGTRFEADLDALIRADDVDALVVVVPVHRHVEIAEAAAEAQKALLIEKPLARSVAEGERIRAVAEVVPLMVAQTLRFDPVVRALRSRAAELGPLRGFSFEQRLEPRGLTWEDNPVTAGGGVLIQTGIHAIDALRFATGADIEIVDARFDAVLNQRTEDHAVITARANGALGTISTSKIGHSRHVRFALYFEGAGLEADLVARTLTEVVDRERTVTELEAAPTIVRALEAFVRVVADPSATNPIPVSEGLLAVEACERAYRRTQWVGAYSVGLPSTS